MTEFESSRSYKPNKKSKKRTKTETNKLTKFIGH